MTQRICVIPECNKPPVGRGWCRTHYSRWTRWGDPLGSAPKKPPILTCTVEGCSRDNHKKGLCTLHYWRLRAKGEVGSVEALKEQGAVHAHVARRVPEITPGACFTEWPFHFTKGRPAAWNIEQQKNVPAVHLAYYFLHGRWPKQLNHICHNGQCWNPHHVYEGTQKENVRDMMESGRHGTLSGEKAPSAKLTQQQVDEIRTTYQARYGERVALAKRYGVSVSTIAAVVKYRSYRS